jgi:DNA helicase-2/ATP-dependent DNA helicase PcrA
LHIRIHGCDEYSHIRQLVIDEAQDEELLHIAILRDLCPYARYTILGDVNQSIGKPADISMYQQISAILGKGKTTFATMEKSFRCTEEIWRFSAKFLAPGMAGQCFSRSGEEPVVHRAASLSMMDDMLTEEVAACKEKGYGSIGLICKTEKDAFIVYERLKSRMALRFIHHDSVAELKGTIVLPIFMAKGLEFDAVLVCDADQEHYRTEDDKRLLYIASTRALHRLNLYYVGEISPLL